MKNKSTIFFFVAIVVLATVLRLYKISTIPPSLYWDEASLGYNAFSILKTAHDEHGKFLPTTNFAAFGDYKPPGYIYLTVPSIALFGLNEFAIRFPSAFFGILTVIITFLVTAKLFSNEKIALLASFFLAISPWHIQFSRAAFEANVGLFFSLLGIYLFLNFALRDSQQYRSKILSFVTLLSSTLAFLAAMYTFTGQRLFAPLIMLVLAVYFWRSLFSNIKLIIVVAVIFLILFWPMFNFAARTAQGKLRFNEVTIFKDLNPINQSINFRETDNFSVVSGLVHNRRLFYINEYLKHYFDAFNPAFLFAKGDVNPRLSPQSVGELYYFDIFLILAGIYFIFKKQQKNATIILIWLLISPLGPASARETPHALRMIHIIPTYQIIAAFGLYYLLKITQRKALLLATCIFAVSLFFFYYLHMYYSHWPVNFSGSWQYGYKQAVQVSKKYYSQVDKIIVTNELGRPYIYFLLYYPFNPETFWKNSQVVVDKFYFINVDTFDKFVFNPRDSHLNASKILYILSPGQLPKEARKLETIYNLEGKQVFDIGIKE